MWCAYHLQTDSVIVLQLATVSRKVAQEANLLLLSKLTDREKLRLGILLGCIKHGLRKIPGGYDIVPSPMDEISADYSRLKRETPFKSKRWPIRQFVQQPEESQFFSIGLKDQNGKRSVTLQPQALIAQPSKELRAMFPNVNWDPLPSLQTVTTDCLSEEEEAEDAVLDSSTRGAGKSVPHSPFNPEPRQVGSSKDNSGASCLYSNAASLLVADA